MDVMFADCFLYQSVVLNKVTFVVRQLFFHYKHHCSTSI